MEDRFRFRKLIDLFAMLVGYALIVGSLIFMATMIRVGDQTFSIVYSLLIFWGIFLGMVLFFGFFTYLSHKRQAHKQKRFWTAFAKQHNFLLKARSGYPKMLLFDVWQAYMKGQYRNREVSFRAELEKNKSFTSIRVHFPQEIPQQEPLGVAILDGNSAPFFRNYIKANHAAGKIESNGQALVFTADGFVTHQERLKGLMQLTTELTDTYQYILHKGGIYIPKLVQLAKNANQRDYVTNLKHYTPVQALRPMTRDLLEDIGHQTTRHIKPRISQLWCPDCLTYCGPHDVQIGRIKLPHNAITYYGCRTCGRSHDLQEGEQMVTVLDTKQSEAMWWQDDTLFINWQQRKSLFDFKRVEIINATDEEVERFTMQVGNDTDSFRRNHYKQVPYSISSECQLSENTKRILAHTFQE